MYILLYLKWITNKDMELCSALQPGWKGSLGENGYTYMYGWVPPLFTWNTTVQFSSVQSLSRDWLCDPMNRSTPGLPVHHQLPELTQTHVHRVSDATQPSHPLSSPFPPASSPSQHQGLFQWVNSSHEYWSFSFSIIPSKEIPGLISFRMDWLDLLEVQGTLKSLLQSTDLKGWGALEVVRLCMVEGLENSSFPGNLTFEGRVWQEAEHKPFWALAQWDSEPGSTSLPPVLFHLYT